jgi:trehalose utilization protein
MGEGTIRVLAWSEMTEPASVYPQGINGALADYLNTCAGITARVAQIADPDQGVSKAALAETDVLLWFGHQRHGEVGDEAVARVVEAVKERGIGYFALHSSHFAKPLKALLGTPCSFRTYVADGKPGRILVAAPDHPIAKGVADFVIPAEEWYGEPYQVPTPEAIIIAGVYNDATELVRDGLVWTVGKGRVFYFRPGHETYPIFYMPEVRRLVENGVRWLARRV